MTKRSEGFAALPKWIITSGLWSKVKPADRNALMCLAVFADADGRCFPTLDTVAHLAGINRRTAERAIESFAGWGVVVVERGGGRGRSNRYRIPQNPDEFDGVLPSLTRQDDRGLSQETPASSSLNPGIPVHKPRSGATETPVCRPDQHPVLTPCINTPPTTPEKTGGRRADLSPVEETLRDIGISKAKARQIVAEADPPLNLATVEAIIAEVKRSGTAKSIAALVAHKLAEGEYERKKWISPKLTDAEYYAMVDEVKRLQPELEHEPKRTTRMMGEVYKLQLERQPSNPVVYGRASNE